MTYSQLQLICCGVSDWVKAVAWLQIAANVIGFWTCFIFVIKSHSGPAFDITLLYTMACLNFAVIGFVFGFILLRGVNQNNIIHLERWYIYAIIALIFYLIVFTGGLLMLFWPICIVLLPLFWTLFGTTVVQRLINEVKSDAAQSYQHQPGNRRPPLQQQRQKQGKPNGEIQLPVPVILVSPPRPPHSPPNLPQTV